MRLHCSSTALKFAVSSAFIVAIAIGCFPTQPATPAQVCCPTVTTTNPRRVRPPAGTPGAALDECSVFRRFSRGVCPPTAQLVCSRALGTTVSQVIVQIVNGQQQVATNTGPTMALLSITCTPTGVWRYQAQNGTQFPFTGVSCTQGTLTSGDYAVVDDDNNG